MAEYVRKYKKSIAIDMRKRGSSYVEIENRLGISKSTLHFWFRDLKFDPEITKKMDERRRSALRAGAKKRLTRIQSSIETIQNSSSKEIGKINSRELWLLGVILYWQHRQQSFSEKSHSKKKDVSETFRKGVNLTSSNPDVVKLFLKWLVDVGHIERDDLTFDIFLPTATSTITPKTISNAKKYWSDVTDFRQHIFTHIYALPLPGRRRLSNPQVGIANPRSGDKQRRTSKRAPYGLLRIRVRSSSLLARQIAGWIKGVKEQLHI